MYRLQELHRGRCNRPKSVFTVYKDCRCPDFYCNNGFKKPAPIFTDSFKLLKIVILEESSYFPLITMRNFAAEIYSVWKILAKVGPMTSYLLW